MTDIFLLQEQVPDNWFLPLVLLTIAERKGGFHRVEFLSAVVGFNKQHWKGFKSLERTVRGKEIRQLQGLISKIAKDA